MATALLLLLPYLCLAIAQTPELRRPEVDSACLGANDQLVTKQQLASLEAASCEPDLPEYRICPEPSGGFSLHLFAPLKSTLSLPVSVSVSSSQESHLPGAQYELTAWRGADRNCSGLLLHSVAPLPDRMEDAKQLYFRVTAGSSITVFSLRAQCGLDCYPWYPLGNATRWIPWLGYKLTAESVRVNGTGQLELVDFVAFVTNPTTEVAAREELKLEMRRHNRRESLKAGCSDDWCRFRLADSVYNSSDRAAELRRVLNSRFAFILPRSYRRSPRVIWRVSTRFRAEPTVAGVAAPQPVSLRRIALTSLALGAALCAAVFLAVIALLFDRRRFKRHNRTGFDVEALAETGDADRLRFAAATSAGSLLVSKAILRSELPRLGGGDDQRLLRLLRKKARTFTPSRARVARDPLVLLLDPQTVQQKRHFLNGLLACEKHRRICLLVAEADGRLHRLGVGQRETPASALAEEIMSLAGS